MFSKSDRILYVLSARQEIAWTTLRDLFDQFYLENLQSSSVDYAHLSTERRSTFRALDALAHCDIDMNDRRAFVARAMFARLPAAGLPRVTLIGARSPSLVESVFKATKQFGNAVTVSIQTQPRELPLVPARILIEA